MLGVDQMREVVEAVRRARRSERVVEEISRCVARDARNRQLGAFDPNVGASGRPEPFFEFPARPPASRREVVWLNHEHHWGERFEWNGTSLTIEEARYNSRTFTIYRPGGAHEVVEAALFASSWGWLRAQSTDSQQRPARIFRGSLHFLDAQGYTVVLIHSAGCAWRDLIDVVKGSGLLFRAYVLACPGKEAREIAELLFPTRRHCVKVRH